MLGPKTTGAEVAESTDTADLQQTKAGLKHAALGESPSTTPSVRLSAPDNPSEIASEGPDVPGRGRHLRAVHVKNRPPIFRRDGLADLHGFRHLFNLLFGKIPVVTPGCLWYGLEIVSDRPSSCVESTTSARKYKKVRCFNMYFVP